MQQHGKSLHNLHRENGMTISSPRGEFDEIQQPYAVDTSRLAHVLAQVLTEESPHPAFPGMLLSSVDIQEEAMGLTRLQVRYLGLLHGTSKPPLVMQRTGQVNAIFVPSSQGFVLWSGGAEIFVTEKSVTVDEPDIDELFTPPNLVRATSGLWVFFYARWDTQLIAIDWEKIGPYYAVTRQYKLHRTPTPSA